MAVIRLGVIVTRNVHIVTLAQYNNGYRASREEMAQGGRDVRQGAGRLLTGSTGATVTIFVGWDSKARELCAYSWEVIH